jgi:hypothetical protein
MDGKSETVLMDFAKEKQFKLICFSRTVGRVLKPALLLSSATWVEQLAICTRLNAIHDLAS